jgi:4-azaleucine resistance transporter AzlC
MTGIASRFGAGVRAALPIAIAYLPVAFALGAASSQLGFSVAESAIWSLMMFSGANQALMLSSIASGVPLIILAFLCIAASLRHALYGIALRDRIDARSASRAVFAYGLTDEVFATACAVDERKRHVLDASWLLGLAMTALFVWISGTALGNAAADSLQAHSLKLNETLDFALPALFFALAYSVARRSTIVPMAGAAAIAVGMVALGRPELAIPVGALAVFLPGSRVQ